MLLERVRSWLADRFGLKRAHDALLDRPVPAVPWYYGDGATLLTLLGVQVGTGALLDLSYTSAVDAAYDSVVYITHHQWLGWFLRGLHYWSAGLLVMMTFYHMFRHLMLGGYKLPREGTWMVGVVLLFVVQGMSLTGYMLRGDERALYAVRVVLNGLHAVPWIGDELVLVAQGGASVNDLTVDRIHATHTLLLPMLFALGVAHHLYLVVVKGVTSPIERKRPVETVEEHRELYKGASHSDTEGERFWPHTVADGLRMGAPIFGVAVLLTLLFGPGELYPEWNLVRDSFPREEWWFFWFSSMAALLPPAIAHAVYVLLPIGMFALLMALPLVDRSPERGLRRRPIAVAAVIVAVGALLYLTDLRRRSPWTGWPVDEPPAVPAGVTLDDELERGRQLFTTWGCDTCHPVAGEGLRQFGPDLARIRPPYAYEELRAIVLEPPPGWVMPSYRGRIPDAELDLVVRYVLAAQTFPRSDR